MKCVIAIVVALILLALIFPLSNLFAKPRANSFTDAKPVDPLQAKVMAILGTKCADCHSAETVLPFYAAMPVVGARIRNDIQSARRYIDYSDELIANASHPVNETALAKTEREILAGGMPPLPYLALHWNDRLSAEDTRAMLDWIHAERAKRYADAGTAPQFENDPVQPLPEKLDLDARKVALGNKLFHDKRLSKDNLLACASCHDLARGGTDQAQVSTGVGNQKGGINSPTVFNTAFQFKMFWDGRAASLEEQADGPVNNPIEMGSNWGEVIPKLQQDAELTAAFNAVYPQGYSKETMTEAMAMFERSLLTPSRFDKYLRGQTDALPADEQHGYKLFKQYACDSCHVGSLLGGQSFELMGRAHDYFAQRGKIQPADLGRYRVTKRETDRYKFKVPTLRNVAITYPYLHDGSSKDLKQIVQLMAKCQTDTDLPTADADALVKFLHTLTGEYNGRPLGN